MRLWRSASAPMLARMVMASRGADAAPPEEMLAACHRLLAARMGGMG